MAVFELTLLADSITLLGVVVAAIRRRSGSYTIIAALAICTTGLALRQAITGQAFRILSFRFSLASRFLAKCVPVAGKTPEEAKEHFGWFAHFVGADIPRASQWTRERLGWQPKQAGLIADIDGSRYFES